MKTSESQTAKTPKFFLIDRRRRKHENNIKQPVQKLDILLERQSEKRI